MWWTVPILHFTTLINQKKKEKKKKISPVFLCVLSISPVHHETTQQSFSIKNVWEDKKSNYNFSSLNKIDSFTQTLSKVLTCSLSDAVHVHDHQSWPSMQCYQHVYPEIRHISFKYGEIIILTQLTSRTVDSALNLCRCVWGVCVPLPALMNQLRFDHIILLQIWSLVCALDYESIYQKKQINTTERMCD